jgi:hypothetical protein
MCSTQLLTAVEGGKSLAKVLDILFHSSWIKIHDAHSDEGVSVVELVKVFRERKVGYRGLFATRIRAEQPRDECFPGS